MNISTNTHTGEYITLQAFDNSMGAIARSFLQVQDRFEQIDERFEQIDERFKRIDERFERIDERFEKIEKVLDLVLSEIRALRSEAREDRLTMAALAHNDLKHDKRLAKLEQKLL